MYKCTYTYTYTYTPGCSLPPLLPPSLTPTLIPYSLSRPRQTSAPSTPLPTSLRSDQTASGGVGSFKNLVKRYPCEYINTDTKKPR